MKKIEHNRFRIRGYQMMRKLRNEQKHFQNKFGYRFFQELQFYLKGHPDFQFARIKSSKETV